jgi:hypothetical protein
MCITEVKSWKTSVGYDIRAACIFSADETINLRDLKRQIHTDLELLPSQFSISISAQINTVPSSLGIFLQFYLGLFMKNFGKWLKQQLRTKYTGIKYLS